MARRGERENREEMTLLDVIRAVETAALRQPAVGMVCRHDVYRLNAIPAPRYAAFAWLQGDHAADIASGLIRYSFTLFYADRLTHDRGNLAEVQSAGVEVLRSVLSELDGEGVYVSGSPAFTPFREKFLDECGGVFCRVTFEVPAGGTCPDPETAADFNSDFGADFLADAGKPVY